jgi:hypothetical protein
MSLDGRTPTVLHVPELGLNSLVVALAPDHRAILARRPVAIHRCIALFTPIFAYLA